MAPFKKNCKVSNVSCPVASENSKHMKILVSGPRYSGSRFVCFFDFVYGARVMSAL